MTNCYGFASVFVRCALTSSQELLSQGNFGVKSVKLMYFLKNLLLYSGGWFRKTECIVIMTKEVSTKIVNFMTTGAVVLVLGRSHISYTVKMHYSFKSLLYSQAYLRQTMYIVMMTKEGFTKIVRAGVLS